MIKNLNFIDIVRYFYSLSNFKKNEKIPIFDFHVDTFLNLLDEIVNMINDIFDILSYFKVSTKGLMNFLVFILLIFVAVSHFKKELGPDCEKGFSRFFVAFLAFLMFSTFFDFGYSLTIKIMWDQYLNGIIPDYVYYDTKDILWGISYGLGFLNKFIAFILLFSAIEIKLLNKKSNFKFLIFAIIFLVGIFLFAIANIVLYYTIGDPYLYFTEVGLGYQISKLVLDILTNLNYIIIAIAIRILLRKTGNENESLKVYTKSISIGVLFLFNLHSIVQIFQNVRYFIKYIFNSNGYFVYNDLLDLISYGLFFLSSLLFIIGIIVLTLGAIKTLSVPLTFSKPKSVIKKIPRKVANKCSECGAPIPVGVEFCTNCGHHL